MKLEKKLLKHLYFLSFLSICLYFLSSCIPYNRPLSEEDILRERVNLYWDKKISGDYDKMYSLEADVNRNRLQLDDYKKVFGDQSKVARYNIEKVNIDSEKKEAKVSITYEIELKIPIPGLLGYKKSLTTDDIWLFENGNWFHVE
ncbi:MAG: hypothetical protein HQK71_12985 [Desulfamplus sp.]|nr:hypothetical protein [Desulfamplus sp.]